MLALPKKNTQASYIYKTVRDYKDTHWVMYQLPDFVLLAILLQFPIDHSYLVEARISRVAAVLIDGDV